MPAETVIQVRDLRKTWYSGPLRRRKVEALRSVSLDIPRGRIFGLLGPNGAGKTTLIKILLGIVRRTSGTATVFGISAGKIAARRRIGYLPENHRVPRHHTGRTALEYYGALSGLSIAEIRRRAPRLLARVGLHGREKDRVTGYSKGMQQRLGLAQAMLHRPELIVLDEPTDGVDPVGRKEIRVLLQELAGDGISIFLNSHLLQEIELICDDVAILTDGIVRRTGSVQQLTEAIAESPLIFRLNADWPAVEDCFRGTSVVRVDDSRDDVLDVHALVADQRQVDGIVDALRSQHISLISMRRRDLTLEEAFLQIVQEDQA